MNFDFTVDYYVVFAIAVLVFGILASLLGEIFKNTWSFIKPIGMTTMLLAMAYLIYETGVYFKFWSASHL